MNGMEYDTERLTDAQITDLLKLTLESELQAEFHRLIGLSSEELIQHVRATLKYHDLGVREAACLIGASNLTVKSWLSSSKLLPEIAHQKLATLCLLLSCVGNDTGNREISELVRTAVLVSKHGPGHNGVSTSNDTLGVVASVFGPVGLMASALHLALKLETVDTVPKVTD